jgi:hypothetical protein
LSLTFSLIKQFISNIQVTLERDTLQYYSKSLEELKIEDTKPFSQSGKQKVMAG